ncbi:hypothetical protein [Pseudodesulfovibrio senegalensis]|uniref:Uncharacterized protein n=1 Tax=Pseudodesulfovibrio senegalensis TaxID=1721087 RepID=A0A6N6N525_9BACT|nr:hypothetical protein [Pseudodesulfovibrio senegalensis]KAB1443282.1 hypothetical protein F8A88_03185 [Pseudodesulfovibrio senegalensis]
MKKFMFLIAALMVMAGASTAFAESHGSTLVPAMRDYCYAELKYIATQVYLSNITSEEVECTVRFYDHDGNDIGDEAKIYTGAYNTSRAKHLSTGSTFSIPANSTRRVAFSDTSAQRHVMGYAIIEWKANNDKIGKALIGAVCYYQRTGTSLYTAGYVQINNGQPF